MKLLQTLLTVALAGVCCAATAQWQWVDKDGRKVFSDRAPPTEIPDKSILKRPAGRATANPATPETNTSGDAPATPAAAVVPDKSAGVDKELEAKKKQAAEAEAAKRKAEEERVTKARVENCARAKQAKASYDSGVRLSRTNAAGEREVLDDATRTAEAKRIQGIIDSDCK